MKYVGSSSTGLTQLYKCTQLYNCTSQLYINCEICWQQQHWLDTPLTEPLHSTIHQNQERGRKSCRPGTLNLLTCSDSSTDTKKSIVLIVYLMVMCHVSHVTYLLSHVTCHLTTTLCSFSCYESNRMFGDAAVGGFGDK